METKLNEAIVGVDMASIYSTDTLGAFFKVFQPATSMYFKITYDPEIFSLIHGSLECSFTQYFMDADTPGVIIFSGSCEKDFSKATTTVRFAFKPKKACGHTEIHLSDVQTDPPSIILVPAQIVEVKAAVIEYAKAQQMKDDTRQ